jgi:hypothetical protein
MNKNTHAWWTAAIAAVFVWAMIGPSASAQQYMRGDVNGDGANNVLDVQACIGQALGALGPSWEADLDDTGQVDILDVQNMVNTALGEGGLVQKMTGMVNCKGDCDMLTIRAMSMDGLTETAEVDPRSGHFTLRLRVNTAWSLSLCQMEQVQTELQQRLRAAFEFAAGDGESSTLPLPYLAREAIRIQLHDQEQGRIRMQETVRQMLGRMAGPINQQDGDGDGIPDFVDPLLMRLRAGAPGVPPNADITPLKELIRPCVEAWLEEGVAPDLTDTDGDGAPDFVEPLLLCIREALAVWLDGLGVEVPPADNDGNGVPDFVDGVMAHVRAGVPMWLRQMGCPELVDEDGDGIPDFVRPQLCMNGEPGPFDSDGDGVPNYAEDYDGDGIPNIDDPDCRQAGDGDGDCIPDDGDLDDDNDGIPDYAD